MHRICLHFRTYPGKLYLSFRHMSIISLPDFHLSIYRFKTVQRTEECFIFFGKMHTYVAVFGFAEKARAGHGSHSHLFGQLLTDILLRAFLSSFPLRAVSSVSLRKTFPPVGRPRSVPFTHIFKSYHISYHRLQYFILSQPGFAPGFLFSLSL